jgi:hypothetical protein
LTNPDGALPQPAEVDAAMSDRLGAAEREVIDGYTRWLIDRDDEITSRWEEVNAAYIQLSERSEEQQRELNAVLSSRWWKLGARLRRLTCRGATPPS